MFQLETILDRNVLKSFSHHNWMKLSTIFLGILDKILWLHHSIELLNFCKGLEQANLLPSPPDLCDLERKIG